jgi:hypothetical protein
MSQQNINQYVFNKWKLGPSWNNLDMSLASDERDFNEEVVFSTQLIGINNGNRLPIYFDLNDPNSSQQLTLNYGDYLTGNTTVSLNYYNPNNENLSCFTGDSLCDIGLTGIDNGLVPEMSGETIYFSMGLYTGDTKWDRYHFDRRTKLIPVKSYTTNTNRFSGNTKETIYNIVSKINNTTGYYNQLYGGFNQGFFKLFGYDYETFPNRCNKGWSVEMLLRARQEDQFAHTSGQTTLNEIYPNNDNTFFYFGTRAENKYYHHASGSPESDSGYTRVTQVLSGCLKTCACSDTGVTISRCLEDIYEPLNYTSQHNVDCNCGCSEKSVANPDKDPLFDSMSNTLSLRLLGDPKNPKVCVRVLKFTGGCETTGSCETTGITYTTGYTITDYCSSKTIFDYCSSSQTYLNKEHWFLIDCVWERNSYYDECDLLYRGGLDSITNLYYVNSLAGNAVSLITYPYTHTGTTPADQIEVVNLNEEWLIEKDQRLGSLKIYVNGRLFYVINGFEEVIPRGLNTEKEKQIGVPFNIGWGGGTQGLRESLTFKTCPPSGIISGLYVNDFNTILGDTNEENLLKSFVDTHNFNTVYYYDLTGILDNNVQIDNLKSFNTSIRLSGVTTIGGIGGSDKTLVGSGTTGTNSRLYYNTGCTEDSQKFDVLNLENEFWNYNNPGTVDFATYYGYLQSVNSSTTLTFDSYISQIDDPTLTYTPTQIASDLVSELDRILIACYITTNQFTGTTNYGLTTIDEELILIGNAAISQNKVQDVIIIFHGGVSYMNDYFNEFGFKEAFIKFKESYDNWTDSSKLGIKLKGYFIYGYQQVKDITQVSSGSTSSYFEYQQDPECMPNETLSGTSLSALTTNIYIEPQFGGSFDGAISQFRMYTEPLTYPEVVHNFDILKGQWGLFDYKCPSCSDIVINDIIGVQSGTNIIFNSDFFSGKTFNLYYYKDSGEPRYVVTENETFPYTMDTTLVPNCCGNNFYFYIIELDQTFLYT